MTSIVAVPEASDAAWAYYWVRNALWMAGVAVALAFPAAMLFTGASARLRDLAKRVAPWWPLTVLAYLAAYALAEALVELPLAWYGGYVVEHRFGLSAQAPAKWAADTALSTLLHFTLGYVVVLAVLALMRASPRRWWLHASAASVPVVLFLFVVAPLWVDPLFNRFGPMKDAALEARVAELAGRAGIEGARIFEVDKSVDTLKVNAYVTGLGGTRRIVLWDTLIDRLEPREVLFITGHEIGHYVLGHVWLLVAGTCALVLAALYAVHRLAGGLLRRFAPRFGFSSLDDIAAYPLVMLVAGVVYLAAAPLFLAAHRQLEREADRFALEITRDNEAGARSFARLAEENLAVPRPNPFLHLLRGSHPTLAERIQFCNAYRPWEEGARLRYGNLFRAVPGLESPFRSP